jgi:hypothetical protein
VDVGVQACQDKFDDWGGSLRGKQEEVIAFSRSIGLSALQVRRPTYRMQRV